MDDEEMDALLDTEGDGVRLGIEVESCGVKTIVMDETTGIKDEQRTYKFFRNEVGAQNNKIPIGYVFQASRYDEVVMLLDRVRKGKHKSVLWYALASHMGSPCAGLFEKPTDHYHLIVWLDDGSKPQDLAFHKSFYRFKHAVEWKSEKVRSERGLLQYIQCEPRELVELYCSNAHRKFVQYCYESRNEMKEKIEARDNKKADGRMSIKTYDDQDWWREKKMEVQAIVNVMITNAIRDVNGFLLWFSKFHADRTIGSFVYNRDKQRLEKEINMQVRRYWYMKTWKEHLEGRRKQIEARVEDGLMLTVEDTIKGMKDIIERNGYQFELFVKSVLDVIYKRRNKLNTLYLQGPSNSCKSTIAWSIINGTPNYGQGMASADLQTQRFV